MSNPCSGIIFCPVGRICTIIHKNPLDNGRAATFNYVSDKTSQYCRVGFKFSLDLANIHA